MVLNSLEKPFFNEIHHFGILVKNIEKAVTNMAALGIGPFEAPKHAPPFIKTTYMGDPVKFENKRLIATIGGKEIELFSPVGEAPSLQKFLDTCGDGIHHFSFLVKDLDQETDKLKAMGAQVFESARWANGGGFAYLSNPNGGIAIELLQF